MVLGVSIVSPNKNQVRTGNTINPDEDPINRAVQADSVAPTIILQAYQYKMDVGKPKIRAVTNGLSCHHFHKS